MEIKNLIAVLRRLKVQTGSLACLGCGLEHDCGVHGCRILREAAEELEALDTRVRELMECEDCLHFDELEKCPDYEYTPCEECLADCYCKDCYGGSKWEWKGADLDD